MFMTCIWCSSFQELFDILNMEISHACEARVVPVRVMKAYEGVEV